MQERYMGVEVNGEQYQIGRFDARTGSWIMMKILAHNMPFGVGGGLQSGPRPMMAEEDFHSIQDHCLALCCRMENGIPMPIFVLESKAFAVKDLEYDVMAVLTLMNHALEFNFKSFTEGGSNEKPVSSKASSPSHTQR